MALTLGMIHGILMMVGFGFLLPAGVLSAIFLKAGNHWYKTHVALQLLGLVVGTAGFILATTNFRTFSYAGDPTLRQRFSHGCVGVTVFGLALLQPLNAVLRPHRTEPDHAKKNNEYTRQEAVRRHRRRRMWEWFHKSVGYVVLILSLTNIILGTKMEGPEWIAGYLVVGLGSLVLLGLVLWCRSRKLKQEDGPAPNDADPELPKVS